MPAGRPSKKLDLDLIEKLAAIHCTNTEIAATIGCDSSLLSKKNYSEIVRKGRERGKQTLRRKMFETAMGGNVTMMIWLSKQILDMTDKKEETIINKELADLIKSLETKSDQELLAIVTKAANT